MADHHRHVQAQHQDYVNQRILERIRQREYQKRLFHQQRDQESGMQIVPEQVDEVCSLEKFSHENHNDLHSSRNNQHVGPCMLVDDAIDANSNDPEHAYSELAASSNKSDNQHSYRDRNISNSYRLMDSEK